MRRERIEEIVRLFGGATRVAERCGVKISAVSNWAARERWPIEHRLKLWQQGKAEGIAMPDWFDPIRFDNEAA